MKKKSKLLNAFVYLSLVVLGVVVGVAVGHYSKLPLAQEVNIIDIAALVVTVFLAVYVPSVLDRRLQALRDRKDLLEKRIEEYQALIRRVNMIVQENRQVQADRELTINNLLDIAGHRLDTLSSLIKHSGLAGVFSREIYAIKKMDDQHRELLTSGLTEKGYSDQTRQQEELMYNKLDEATSILIFKISNTQQQL